MSEKGYFYQELDDSGYQHEKDYNWSVDSLLEKTEHEVSVQIGDRTVYINAWKYVLEGVDGKSIPIYFLDANNEKVIMENLNNFFEDKTASCSYHLSKKHRFPSTPVRLLAREVHHANRGFGFLIGLAHCRNSVSS